MQSMARSPSSFAQSGNQTSDLRLTYNMSYILQPRHDLKRTVIPAIGGACKSMWHPYLLKVFALLQHVFQLIQFQAITNMQKGTSACCRAIAGHVTNT